MLVHRNLTFERMAFLFATVIAVGGGTSAWSLHVLLKRINDDGEVGRFCQQGIQRAPVFLARIGLAHRVPPCPFQQRQDALNNSAHRGMAQPKQEAEHFVHGILAQPNHGQQELLTRGQVELPSTAQRPLTGWAAEAGLLSGGKGGQEVGHQRLKFRHSQARQMPKHTRMVAQVRRT